MSFYIAVILAVVIIDYILLRFLMSALSKIVAAKMIHVFHSTLDYVFDNNELSEDIKKEVLTVYKDKLEENRHFSEEEVMKILKRD